MATIQALMPYLERGFKAADHARMGPAYLEPVKQENETLAFRWTAYNLEGEWAKPTIHSRTSVLAWTSNDWGIHCHTDPGGGSEYDVDDPAEIEEAIAGGLAYKAEGFE